jgi:hypothetical protein
MDLNHIELPAFVVAGLYNSSLICEKESLGNNRVADENDKVALSFVERESVSPWKSLGGNLKNILVVVNNTTAVHLPDNELTFLTGILSACKLSLADVSIFNLNNHPATTYKELTSFFETRVVVLFDTEPASFGLPMSFPPYQIQPFAGISFLYSPSLKKLETDKVEKSKLWVCLKRLFNL